MPVARPELHKDVRVIAHVDMDCFYVQVEQRKRPDLKGVPTAVVQYNSWKGGGLIAVSYEARKYGVKRSMRGDEAKKVCPEIQLIQVPVARGKADLNLYRDAGSEVVSVLARKGRCERASIDEVYLDLTDAARDMLSESPPETLEALDDETTKTHVIGICKDEADRELVVKEWLCRSDADCNDKLLACGAVIVAALRKEVLMETKFTCSAGIAHNKLGGKLGSSVESDLGVHFVGDLLQFSEEKLQSLYGINTGTWLWNIARGISGEEVKGRLLPMSHGCGKTFPGPKALRTISAVQNWLNELCEELNERIQSDLEQNQRVAQTLTLHARAYQSNVETEKKFPSKSCPLRYGTQKLQEDALKLFNSGLHEYIGLRCQKEHANPDGCSWGVTALSVSASNIHAVPSGIKPITEYFRGCNPACSSSAQLQTSNVIEESSAESDDGYGSNQAEEKAAAWHEGISNTNVMVKRGEVSYGKNNSWDYGLDNIDPSVLEELPIEIQEEIRAAMRPAKRANNVKKGSSANNVKKGSSIVHYFLPVKKE
ncbi:DNA polymerase eta isoform X2 [Nymphaea colorata]|uniref:DNA polymerase eta isoform X2 n=1 Tax=Nymphaea colorata TaxID=210225 RepID=UPI00214E2B52|nr:DNA polymerase eta isoform X2 [Nymphaea colorata]